MATKKKAVARKPPVSGGPAAARELPNLGVFVGAALKRLRQDQNLTIQDVSRLSDISRGMLSRIENGQVMPSLDTLSRVCRAVNVSISQLFKDYDMPDGAARYVPAGQGMTVVRRGTKRGHSYELLSYDQGPKKLFEPFLITLDDQSEVFPRFQHAGTEFLYMLKGRIEYRHGQHTYVLKPGDSLTFSGDIPHGPERLIQMPIQFLAVIYYGTGIE
jgi:transcriptional regulator with XRE-family HTH domain